MIKNCDRFNLLSEQATTLGKWIAAFSGTGSHADAVNYYTIQARFCDITEPDLLEIIAELAELEFVTTEETLGGIPHVIRPTVLLFACFDLLVLGASPRADAALIAQHLLTTDNSETSAMELCELNGWDVRRINPALSIIGQLISSDRRRSPPEQPFTVQYILKPTRIDCERLQEFIDLSLAGIYQSKQ